MTATALLIAKNWPEPNSTAAGRRTLDLLKLIVEAGFTIHVACPAEPTPFQEDLNALGWQTHKLALNDSASDQLFKQLDPALVIFDRFVMEEQFSWRVRSACPNAITLLDTSDLHCLRTAREQSLKKNIAVDLLNEIALREIAAIYRCDLTLMISKVEIELLKKYFSVPDELLHYLPFLTEEKDFEAGVARKQRHHLVVLGGLKHEPNRDAVRWLKAELWPRIRPRLPKHTELHIVGSYADHAINQLHNASEGFLIKGRVENAIEVLKKYRVNLAPLRFGAGQKGKVLEGWLTQTPTITTPIAAESMAHAEELGYTPAAEPEFFSEQVIKAYIDDSFAEQLISNGERIIRKYFRYQDHATFFMEKLQQLTDNIEQYRHNNFYGRLLWQNQFRANEYMSRWIELKNK